MKRLILALATIGGIGFFPFASGTLGSAVAMIPYYFCRHHALLYITVTLGFVFVGLWSSGRAEKYLGEKDPHAVVIDEVAGYLIAAAFLPSFWGYPVAAFFLFRLFDVWKPFPIRQSQNLGGGLGIMIDDVLAGLLTNFILQVVYYFTKVVG